MNGLGPVSKAGRCVFLPTVDPSSKTRLLYESKILSSVHVQRKTCVCGELFIHHVTSEDRPRKPVVACFSLLSRRVCRIFYQGVPKKLIISTNALIWGGDSLLSNFEIISIESDFIFDSKFNYYVDCSPCIRCLDKLRPIISVFVVDGIIQ